jgi:hypothetical protein
VLAESARHGSDERRISVRARQAFAGLYRRFRLNGDAAARLSGHAVDTEPRFGRMTDKPIRKVVNACPHCGGTLLFVEGVAHRARAVELDDQGKIHGVEFSDPKPVGYHRLTWLECDANCEASQLEGLEFCYFRGTDLSEERLGQGRPGVAGEPWLSRSS